MGNKAMSARAVTGEGEDIFVATTLSKRTRRALKARGCPNTPQGVAAFLHDAGAEAGAKHTAMLEVAALDLECVYELYMRGADYSDIDIDMALLGAAADLVVPTDRDSHVEAFVAAFARRYYEDNKYRNFFPDHNAVYLLVHRIIALAASAAAAAPEERDARSANLVEWVAAAQGIIAGHRRDSKPMLELVFARVTEDPALAAIGELSPRPSAPAHLSA